VSPGRDGDGGGRRQGDRPVAAADYYGRPIIKPPVWEEREIAGYLFTGGLAGASSILAAGADLTGRPALARGSRVMAVGAIGVSLGARWSKTLAVRADSSTCCASSSRPRR
jgi:hypothetical protein